MNIGILGVSFNVGNKGCEALSYGFLELLNQIAEESHSKITCYVFVTFPARSILKIKKAVRKSLPTVEFSHLTIKPFFYRVIKGKIIFLTQISKLDFAFDFTAGDSFTDIYGRKRFFDRTKMKEQIINKNVPFILGSQTIGPFNDDDVKKMAVMVISKCKEVFVRDRLSYDYVKEISGRTPILTTDVAFFLPYKRRNIQSDKIKIGINPSGLLWEGGYTRDNQFGLTIDYRKYIITVIDKLLATQKYDIYLIPHATSEKTNFADNDLIAIKELKDQYPNLIYDGDYQNSIDAKSYISGMDLFIGARMHATIASFSSGVPVIPVSYSRKFEGLYNSLDYPYVISATKLSTEEAVIKTLDWIEKKDYLKEIVDHCSIKVKDLSNYLKDEIKKTISIT